MSRGKFPDYKANGLRGIIANNFEMFRQSLEDCLFNGFYDLVILIESALALTSRRINIAELALIRLDAIGDFIVWLDTAKEYRSLYPNHRITLIANSAWANLARNLPYWDEVWPLDIKKFSWRNPIYRWKTLRRVATRGFSIVIQPTYSRVLWQGDSIIRASGAPERIGSTGNLSNITSSEKSKSDKWYTRLLPASTDELPELMRNAEFLISLSGKSYQPQLPVLPQLLKLRQELRDLKNYMVIFPGASWVGRQWPTQKFIEVARSIQSERGCLVVLCGSSAEHDLCTKIAQQLCDTAINLAGKTSLAELAEILRNAQILISNETSAVHIATAVGTPSVCILGGGHFGRFLPYPEHINGIKPVIAFKHMTCFGCNWKCSRPHDPSGAVPCIDSVNIKQILALIDQAIKAS